MGSLFAGIGGLDLGLERAGMRVVWQVEEDAYCNKVLARHWPGVRRYGAIESIDWAGVERPDLVCGGFPCQPVSWAGSRRAQDDERWLWPEFDRCLRVVRPRLVLVENVPGLLVRGLGDVLGSLSELGYDAEWQTVPAAAVGAPHLRYRVVLVAHQRGAPGATADPERERLRIERQRLGMQHDEPWQAVAAADGPVGTVADTDSGRRQGQRQPQHRGELGQLWAEPHRRGAGRRRHRPILDERPTDDGTSWWDVEPGVGRVADGVPGRVDRLRALGNAVVPQVAEWAGHAIVRWWHGQEAGR